MLDDDDGFMGEFHQGARWLILAVIAALLGLVLWALNWFFG